ncbi:MAG: ABC transporter ATP-binding protein [Phycisphaerales bacterium]|nr:MAG: ABC transporter ATP-binding protein [Phycisphaerales bacterium]
MSVILEADQIRVEFGPLVAVRDVSFQLSGGQLLGLVGPNGAGKTTLLRSLSGLHAPTRGEARIMGQPVLGQDEVVRQHVGFAPDTPPAYEELTINQFLRFIAEAYELSSAEAEERIDFWLERLWLAERRHTKINELSRGMRQRLTLARTFVPRPHVLLLDEPLTGLDPKGRIHLRGVLRMLAEQGCAMVVSSHILSDLEEVATHIAIIEHGSIIRWSETHELHHEQEGRRTYRLVTVDFRPQHRDVLEGIEGIEAIENEGRTYTFDYYADERRVSALLRQLVLAEIPVISFDLVKTSLEQAYLKAGVKQMD